ncbi:uncharacterized protein LOC144924671 isoform X2 [Branchiostoma floridae x Branchiostoma belcheri]
MLPMYNTDLNFRLSVLIAGVYMYLPTFYLERWNAYNVKEWFGPPESDEDIDECKTSTDSWSRFAVTEWLSKVQGLLGQGLEVRKSNEAKRWNLQSLGMDVIKRVKEIVRANISPKKHFLSMFSADVSITPIKSHDFGHNAFSLLFCNTAESKTEDKRLSAFPDHHTVIEMRPSHTTPRPRQNKPRIGLVVITNVIIRQPGKSGHMGNHDENQDSTIQGEASRKTVDMEDGESKKFTYIKQSRGQRVWNGPLSDGHCRVVAVWRPEVEVVRISSPSFCQVEILEGPQERAIQSCQEQDQHTAEEWVTDPDDSHGDEDDEDDQDYFTRMTDAYRKNFCEEAADLFIRIMEAGRWADIVRQLNFTKARADQLFDDSVSALKQKAGEAYDSHPHHSSPPESLFRIQEHLVREAVLALAQECRQENVISPQFFEKK